MKKALGSIIIMLALGACSGRNEALRHEEKYIINITKTANATEINFIKSGERERRKLKNGAITEGGGYVLEFPTVVIADGEKEAESSIESGDEYQRVHVRRAGAGLNIIVSQQMLTGK